MSWRSTTLRFAVLVFLLQLAAGLTLLGITVVAVRQEIESGAAIRANTLRQDLLVTYGQGGLPALRQAVDERSRILVTPGTVLLLTDAHGRVIAGNLARWPANIPSGTRHSLVSLYRIGGATPEAMWVRATSLGNGARLLTGGVVEGEQRVFSYLRTSLVAGLSMAIAFAALAAWITARLIVSRLRTTVDTLEAVRAGDLERRVAEDSSGDAFAALTRAVNVTLERVDTLVRELQIATDGLAHDLKSPLTRLRSALERVAIAVRDPSAQRAVDSALGESDRLLAIVETALRISRAEAGVDRGSFVPVDLATELNDIAEIYGPVVEQADRSIDVDAPISVTLPVQRELLGQAIGNLVDNALKYGAGAITLRLRRSPQSIIIAVDDCGPGIPPKLREQALSRFGRLDEARRVAGAGLGLPLVSAVARLHGGAIELASAGSGFSVRIHLSADPTADTAAILADGTFALRQKR